jgi:serine/threonine protein kinase
VSPVGYDTLVLGACLGSGGQGTVHRVLNRKINSRWPVAYKEYNAAAQDLVDIDALTAMVELIPALSGSTAEWLCTMAAWPAALVERQGRISGFLMRTAPDEYYFDYRGFDGAVTRKLATAEFLLNSDSYTCSIGLYVNERERLRLLADLAAKLSRLHTLGIAVGDMSPKNLLFTSGSGPSCFLIDCDTMRINGRGILPQAETPDWQIPAGEEKGTPSSDVYKLALLAVRLFARDQTSRDPGVLPADAEPKLAELARAGLHGHPGDRPALGEWAEYCLSAASSPQLVITPRVDSAPGTTATADNSATAVGKPTGSGLTARARRVIGAAAAAVLAVVVIVAVASNHGGQPGVNPTSTSTSTFSASSTPSDSSAPPESSAPPAPPSTPVSDPDNASTDLTPFTADALLPSDFTDSAEDYFTRRSANQASCIVRDQNSTVQNILTQNNCVSLMAGSYVNDAGTILVSVEVMRLTDVNTAQQVDIAVKQAAADGDIHAGDLGFWCPQSGTGSICDSSYFSAATKAGEYEYSHRYFINAEAVWINLSQDQSSSAEDPLQVAAVAAVQAAGPQNYSGG